MYNSVATLELIQNPCFWFDFPCLLLNLIDKEMPLILVTWVLLQFGGLAETVDNSCHLHLYLVGAHLFPKEPLNHSEKNHMLSPCGQLIGAHKQDGVFSSIPQCRNPKRRMNSWESNL